MSALAFWRKLRGFRQPSETLTIDILSDDILDLGKFLIALPDRSLTGMHWTRDGRNRAFEALNAHAMRRFNIDGTVDPENSMQPVTMSKDDWRKVALIAMAAQKIKGPGEWPSRVALRIMAEGLPEGL